MLNKKQKGLVAALLTPNNTEKALQAIAAIDDLNFAITFRQPLRKLFPLHLASKKSGPEVVTAMLNKGARVNIFDDEGRTPLHYAQDSNKLDNANILIQHKPVLTIIGDNADQTPLHEAALNNKLPFLKMYLNTACDVDVRNNMKRTPLHEAVRNNSKDATKLLISHGADIQAKDIASYTPYDYALQVQPLDNVSHRYPTILHQQKLGHDAKAKSTNKEFIDHMKKDFKLV